MRRREQSSRCRSNMNHCVKSCCVRPSQENHLIDLVFGWGQKRQLIVCVWVTSYMIPTSLMFNSFFLKAEKKNPGLKKKTKTHTSSARFYPVRLLLYPDKSRGTLWNSSTGPWRRSRHATLPADWRSDTQPGWRGHFVFLERHFRSSRSECFYHYTPLQSGHLFWPWEMVLKVSLCVCVHVCVLEKLPGLRCSMKICSEQPLSARRGRIRGKLFGGGGTGAQSNLFVHTPAEPDQNNWYIRTGFREQIWQLQRERERRGGLYIAEKCSKSKFTSWAIAQGAIWNYDKKEIALFPLLSI